MKTILNVVLLAALLPVCSVQATDPNQDPATLEAKLKNSHAEVLRQKAVVQNLTLQNEEIQSSNVNRTATSSEAIITNRIVLEASKLELAREVNRLAVLMRAHKDLLDTIRTETIIDSGRLLDRLTQYQLPDNSSSAEELDKKAKAMLSQLADSTKSSSLATNEAKVDSPTKLKTTQASLASVATATKVESSNVTSENHLLILRDLGESNSLVQGEDGTLKIRNSGGEWTLEIVHGRCNHCRPLGRYGSLDIYFHQCDGRYIAVIKR